MFLHVLLVPHLIQVLLGLLLVVYHLVYLDLDSLLMLVRGPSCRLDHITVALFDLTVQFIGNLVLHGLLFLFLLK